jgi:hypothetical protein
MVYNETEGVPQYTRQLKNRIQAAKAGLIEVKEKEK